METESLVACGAPRLWNELPLELSCIFILEPEPVEDLLGQTMDPMMIIDDDIPIPLPPNTSTNISPVKSDVEQSNIVSSTASG